jgi:hypothetical protein
MKRTCENACCPGRHGGGDRRPETCGDRSFAMTIGGWCSADEGEDVGRSTGCSADLVVRLKVLVCEGHRYLDAAVAL